MADVEASSRARARWKLLYKTLKGTSEIDNDENSTRSFPGYKLFKITEINSGTCSDNTQSNTSKHHAWFKYSFPKLPHSQPIKIRHLRNTTQAKDLVGFDNTGNVCVWPSEEVLAYYCIRNKNVFKEKTVCELGCGMTGLAGMFVAANTDCSKMLLTDGNDKSVDNLSSIIEENCGSCDGTEISSTVLRWGENLEVFSKQHGKFDVIISADCLFFVNVQSQLLESIERIMTLDGVCIMLAPRRSGTLERFVGLACDVFDVTVAEDYEELITHLHNESCGNKLYSSDLHYPVLVRLSHKQQ